MGEPYTPEPASAGKYYKRWWRLVRAELRNHLIGALLAALSTIVGVLSLVYFQINPADQTWARIASGMAFPLILPVFYLFYHVFRAPWTLHVDDQGKATAEFGRLTADHQTAVTALEAAHEQTKENLRILQETRSSEGQTHIAELQQLRKSYGAPQVSLSYANAAQLSGFYFENTGEATAFNIEAESEPLLDGRVIQFGKIDKLKPKAEYQATFDILYWDPHTASLVPQPIMRNNFRLITKSILEATGALSFTVVITIKFKSLPGPAEHKLRWAVTCDFKDKITIRLA